MYHKAAMMTWAQAY